MSKRAACSVNAMVFGDLTNAYHVTDCYYVLKADSQTLFHVISFLSACHHRNCLTTELHHSPNVSTTRTDLVVGSLFWIILLDKNKSVSRV
jgi:hypothetical protein